MKNWSRFFSLLLVVAMVFAMPFGANLAEEKHYTLNDSLVSSPTRWSPHTWETTNDSTVFDYLSSSLYQFDFVKEHPAHGYQVICDMAAELPVDITKELAGKPEWGIPKDAQEGYAYKIALNKDAMWEDGTPINADTYIYSMQQLLNPKMQNYRADSYYNGELVLVNARNYVYQNSTKPMSVNAYMKVLGVDTLDAFIEKAGTTPALVNWANSFGEIYNAEKSEWAKEGFENKVVEAKVDLAKLKELFIEKVTSWGKTKEEALKFYGDEAFVSYTYPELSFDKVGLRKTGDYEIEMILAKPLKGFYLFYNLGSTWLVNEKLYEANKRTEEGSDLIKSTYMTNVDTSISFGPYKLKTFQDDKSIEFVRNENWHGYKKEENKGLYQADRIYLQIVKESATQLQMFLAGQLDYVGLNSEQAPDYRGSDSIYYTLSSYTNNLLFLANKEQLAARQEKGFNKTIMSILEFRKALSLSVDRKDFAAATTASSSAGFGLLNSRYIADVETLKAYREYDQAKQTLLEVYDVEYGEGKPYATLDEAYDALTGYNLDHAKELFNQAYDKAIADGLMREGDIVKLTLISGADNENTRKQYNYLRNNWIKAVEGTKLAGKFELEFDPTAGNQFGDKFKDGQGDVLMAGWNGAELNPFYFMLAYLDANYRYAQSFNADQQVEIEIEGKAISLPASRWYGAMMGDDAEYKFGPNDASMEVRVKILSALERCVLLDYTSCPTYYGRSSVLKSHKVNFYSEEYNKLLGRGGVKYNTFNYDDAAWDEYVKSNNGILDYK